MLRPRRPARTMRVLATLALASASIASLAAPPLYRITPIVPPPGQSACQVLGLNDHGQAVGVCNVTGFFVWSEAGGARTYRDPDFPHAALWPMAINNAGVVMGGSDRGPGARKPGFLWDAENGFRYFGGKPGYEWEYRAINDANVVVGVRAVDDGRYAYQSYEWSEADGMTFLRPSANRRALAFDINDAGQICGSIENLATGGTYALRYEPDGSVTEILPWNRPGTPYAINEAGHAAGGLQTPKHGFQAFLWSPQAGVVNIDNRPLRSDESHASDMNDADEVVGSMSWLGAGGNTQEAFFHWDAVNGMLELMSLLDPDDPLTGQVLQLGPDLMINNHGQIAVDSFTVGDELSPLLLTPVAR